MCPRRSSCCTASAAPAAPGTASRSAWTANATGRWRSTSRARRQAAGSGAADHASPAASSSVLAARARALRAVRLLAGRARRAARRAGRARARLAPGARRVHTRASRTPPSAPPGVPADERARRASSRRPLRGLHRALAHPAAVRRRPAGVGELARADQRRNRPERAGGGRCAASAPGEMEPLWGRLGELAMPGRGRRRARREVPGARRAHGRGCCRGAGCACWRAATGCALENPAGARAGVDG